MAASGNSVPSARATTADWGPWRVRSASTCKSPLFHRLILLTRARPWVMMGAPLFVRTANYLIENDHADRPPAPSRPHHRFHPHHCSRAVCAVCLDRAELVVFGRRTRRLPAEAVE